MKTCPYCKIDVGGDLKKCPFCQSTLSGTAEPAYFPKQTTLKLQSFFYKLQMFIVFAVMIVSLGAEWLLKLDLFHGIRYSLLICMWLVAFEFGIMKLFKKGFHPARVLTLFVIIVMSLLAVTAWELGLLDYLLNWILPIVVMGTMIANYVLAMADQISNALVYLLTNIVVGILPYIVLYFLGKDIPVIWIVCLMLTIILFVGAIIFRARAVFSEVQKRFNV